MMVENKAFKSKEWQRSIHDTDNQNHAVACGWSRRKQHVDIDIKNKSPHHNGRNIT